MRQLLHKVCCYLRLQFLAVHLLLEFGEPRFDHLQRLGLAPVSQHRIRRKTNHPDVYVRVSLLWIDSVYGWRVEAPARLRTQLHRIASQFAPPCIYSILYLGCVEV